MLYSVALVIPRFPDLLTPVLYMYLYMWSSVNLENRTSGPGVTYGFLVKCRDLFQGNPLPEGF